MNSHIELAKSLDALIVLGGEGEDPSRTNLASELYTSVTESRQNPLHLILTGHHSILNNQIPELPEAEIMRRYLLSTGVPAEAMHTEEKSLDTLGNIIYSWDILDNILSGSQSRKVGIVTDKFHIDRSLWTAKRVWGDSFDVQPFPTEKDTSFPGIIKEKAIALTWKFDLWKAGIKPSDYNAFKEYMEQDHPGPAYRAGINLHNLLLR